MTPPTRENVLDLEARKAIFDLIQERPGLHLRGVADATGQAVSTVEYHLHQLVKFNLIVSRPSGNAKGFFPAELGRRDADLLALLRHDAPRHICTHLLLHPGSTPKELKLALHIPAPTLSFHLKKLLSAELLREKKMGRSKQLWVHDSEHVGNLLVAHRTSFGDAVDRFASLWQELGKHREIDQ